MARGDDMKVNDLYLSVAGLQKLVNCTGFKLTTQIEIARLAKRVNLEFEPLAETKDKIDKEYELSQKGTDEEIVKGREEYIQKAKEFSELDVEIKFDKVKINSADLDKVIADNLTPADLMSIIDVFIEVV